MTNEEAIEELKTRYLTMSQCLNKEELHKANKAIDMAIQALEQKESYDFARWVAEEIFDEMWEYNKDAFGELACRKLARLGIVRAKDNEWELIEEQ